jgi:hypothetical protein
VTEWTGVPGTNIEISADGTEFRWTFDIDGADFLAAELHPDGTSREMYLAITAAEERRRQLRDQERFGVYIVMVPRD